MYEYRERPIRVFAGCAALRCFWRGSNRRGKRHEPLIHDPAVSLSLSLSSLSSSLSLSSSSLSLSLLPSLCMWQFPSQTVNCDSCASGPSAAVVALRVVHLILDHSSGHVSMCRHVRRHTSMQMCVALHVDVAN